ncbi:MAG: S-methyl-5'-thioadenosine phosphorylase [Thermodesulfovibrionales bacterium]|jgi:5'-methylthioadenosine phosphorylase
MPPIGLIGGSGIYEMAGLEMREERTVSTPFGEPSSDYRIGSLDGRDIIFLPRHGSPHAIPPHRVNYRANIWGFRSLGVERIITVNAVGGINRGMPPGSIVILDQIIDMTAGARPSTFYEEGRVVHVDFTDPYCPEMRDAILGVSRESGIPVAERGTYICVNGPRLETAQEIRFFSRIGADVVGMTGMPEAVLARELEICMAGIAVVTNYAAGISASKLTTTEVIETMEDSLSRVRILLREAVRAVAGTRGCPCRDALKDAIL